MQHVTFEEGKEICLNHRCAQCDSILVLAWDGKANLYAVRCGNVPAHEGFTRIPTLFEARATGVSLPMELEQVFQRKEERQMKEVRRSAETALMTLVPREDAGTQKAITPAQAQMLIKFAESIGLNPYMRHVDLYFGLPRVTIYGRYYHARRQPEYLGMVSRPLTTNERTAMMLPEGEHCWLAEVKAKDGTILAMGYGFAQENEMGQLMKGVSESWATPQRRAEKRAEEDALAKAFPIGLPPILEEEVSDDLPDDVTPNT